MLRHNVVGQKNPTQLTLRILTMDINRKLDKKICTWLFVKAEVTEAGKFLDRDKFLKTLNGDLTTEDF